MPQLLYPQVKPDTHCLGGWVGPRASLDKCGKSCPHTGIQSLDCPACSELLYQLRNPSSQQTQPHRSNILVLYSMLLHISADLGRHRLTQRIKRGEASPNKHRLQLYKTVMTVILKKEWQHYRLHYKLLGYNPVEGIKHKTAM
jgi:hypothetical protein